MTNKQALEKSYALLSPYSDKQRWEFNSNLVHLNLITGSIPPTAKIFDAGCGIGILALALTLRGYVVEGGDKYTFVLNDQYYVKDIEKLQAVWEANNLRITNKDIYTDVLDKKYGCVTSVATIEHLKNPKFFLEKLLVATEPGGYVYIATPNVTHLLNRLRFLFGLSPLYHGLKDFFFAGESYTGHWREYTLKELVEFFNWLNIKIIFAKNIQGQKPFRRFKNLRQLYVDCFSFLSYFIPGTRDTNSILAQKNT